MLMMFYMFIGYCHLTATDASADVRHTIVIANLLMLVIRIIFASLCCVEHDFLFRSLVITDERASTRGSYHLISIERQDTILAESTENLTFIFRAETLSCIFYNRNLIAVSDFHYLLNFIRHTIESHRNYSFRFLAGLSDAVFDGFFKKLRVHVPSVAF